MYKKLILSLMVISVGCGAFCAQNFSYQMPDQQQNFKLNNNTLKGRVVSVPAGELFNAVFTEPISSETVKAGEEVTLALSNDFYYNGKKIAPAGSTVTGSVIGVSSAKHGTLNGKLTLRFTHIITPTGLDIPISAVIKTDDNTGTLMGGTAFDSTKEYTKDLAIGAATGAILGTIAAPLSGGSVGRGAALMTAVGAGGGLVKSIWDKGSEVEIPTGATVELVLTQPITVNPPADEN